MRQAGQSQFRELPLLIEDYALIGNCRTAALIGKDGAIDWLCVPRFDSAACLAAILGTAQNGSWKLEPEDPLISSKRTYRKDTLILETTLITSSGEVVITDVMPKRNGDTAIIRQVKGVRGKVRMRFHLRLRFDYGMTVPWVTHLPDEEGIRAIAGPDQIIIRSSVPLHSEGMNTVCYFEVSEGQNEVFVLQHAPSHMPVPPSFDPYVELAETEAWWQDWSAHCTYKGPWRDAVVRSLIVLKALTYAPTGGIVAAPTTSLPEDLGGIRNWDYRYCWLRDAALTLSALISCGYYEEAQAWNDWLHRSIAGDAGQTQIMYGVSGERILREWNIDNLPGYHNAKPVRIGNGAADQIQLDIYGIMAHVAQLGRNAGLTRSPTSWALQINLLNHLEKIWKEPDHGIWEVRGGTRHFVHSKVMAWLAFDCALKDMARYNLEGPAEKWEATRQALHADICSYGFNVEMGCFVQYYGASEVDASLLLLPLVGFLPISDPRIQKTIKVIEEKLLKNGFLHRYETEGNVDGLNSEEGAFLACSFWLADVYALDGRKEAATALFERLLSIRNDVGLLAEEYETHKHIQLGNFPQGFSHLALIHTALILSDTLEG
ncbi:glycoside hydrolase family 15 protein [Acetobacter indonesiensis]|uniref:glycoside hydrolase family 15 protein n=1 Tax=Acetobacter indonesiensis TaxID=104101 RepID=UPI001F3405CB|nr:glycoside hydrolase family 15 protein [Acetobacter indonesiensis]MCG0995826.1 glycoside hydrolase family 15 protein [Acetobacter indonesiensis]